MAVEHEFIELKLDQVVLCLEDYLGGLAVEGGREDLNRMATEALEGLRKLIAYRGNVLFSRKRVKKFTGTCLGIEHRGGAENPAKPGG